MFQSAQQGTKPTRCTTVVNIISPKNDWRLRDKTKQNDDVVNVTEFAVTHFTTHNLNVSLRHFQNTEWEETHMTC